MEMVEAYPGVWLPEHIKSHARTVTAEGPVFVNYETKFSDFKRSEVKVEFYVDPLSSLDDDDQEQDDSDKENNRN